ATEPSVPGWRPHRGKCRHSPRFFTYRADAANFCRFVCTKGALYKIIRRTNNRAEMKMPYPMGRLRTLKGSGGIFIGRLFFATALHKAVFCVRTAITAACHRQGRLMPLKFQPRERSVIMCDFRGY
ncbi:LOW QUALITY PROTEIN: hypothetical protein NGCG_02065, partial [Neisseria gonorrhoeae DGI18]